MAISRVGRGGQNIGWINFNSSDLFGYNVRACRLLDAESTFLSPNGEESFLVGKLATITWQDNNCVQNVSLDYSINNGSTWISIDPNTLNDGLFDWNPIPIENSEQCLIRICDVSNPLICDASDNVFTIFECLESARDISGNCFVDDNDVLLFMEQWLLGGNPFDPAWIP